MHHRLVALVGFAFLVLANYAEGQIVVFKAAYGTATKLVNRSADLWKKGDLAGARAACDEALRLDPKNSPALINRAMVAHKEKKYEEAMRDLNTAIRAEPYSPYNPFARAVVYESLGKPQLALINYANALRLGPPQDVRAAINNQIAWLQATSPDPAVRNGKRAVAHAEAAYRFATRKSDYIDTLAAAYAEAGNFEKAVNHQESAIAKAEGNAEELRGFRNRLALYRAGKPYRQPAR